ncbi:hypothetical protein AK812_SmicGene30559 [Symbiodinium microadriaticum]|uniref:Uncharacterized protein n=1 Tax=Symbiodinium microadriaticum TaxID=2951 RepID=A0A1Q9CZ45_SYMMI|nr:hypothetical protein AK812_SmicGene30559 [Symbiodinium microadriaticum]
MGNVNVKLTVAGDVLRNVLTGHYEKGVATSPERTAQRRKNCLDAIHQVLHTVVGPGDLLSSDLRHDVAAEAYAAWGSCQGCFKAKAAMEPPPGANFAAYNRDIDHDFTTQSPFRDLVHGLVNRQNKLSEEFFQAMLQRFKDVTDEVQEEDVQAMAVELTTVVALCVGVRAFCSAYGVKAPALPQKMEPCKPGRFQHVSDYSNGQLQIEKSMGWGPYLPSQQLRPEALERFGLERSELSFGDNPRIPTSKASAAPLTYWEFLKFRDVMYVPTADVARFMKVPGLDRTLNRGQLEVAAAEYTTAKISALAAAVASPEKSQEPIRLAREALREKGQEHALLDVAGIIGFFATITIVVDFTGHKSEEFAQLLTRMASIIDLGRRVRSRVLG